jgi:hypothetical protein
MRSDGASFGVWRRNHPKANQAELDLLGYTAEEYIGRKISDFHAEHSHVVYDTLARQMTEAPDGILTAVEHLTFTWLSLHLTILFLFSTQGIGSCGMYKRGVKSRTASQCLR